MRSRRLALVDVEGLVSSGAPRDVFRRLQSGWFEADLDALAELGWEFLEDGSWIPAQQGVLVPHPYALGPQWDGHGSCWRGHFHLADGREPVVAQVDSVWCRHDHAEDVDRVWAALTRSDDWWRWGYRVDGEWHAGTASTPLQAAITVEDLVVEAGGGGFQRTSLERHAPPI